MKAKTELWMKQNEEYLREQKGKRTEEEEFKLYTRCILISGACGTDSILKTDPMLKKYFSERKYFFIKTGTVDYVL